jgi:hypothetical protein
MDANAALQSYTKFLLSYLAQLQADASLLFRKSDSAAVRTEDLAGTLLSYCEQERADLAAPIRDTASALAALGRHSELATEYSRQGFERLGTVAEAARALRVQLARHKVAVRAHGKAPRGGADDQAVRDFAAANTALIEAVAVLEARKVACMRDMLLDHARAQLAYHARGLETMTAVIDRLSTIDASTGAQSAVRSFFPETLPTGREAPAEIAARAIEERGM